MIKRIKWLLIVACYFYTTPLPATILYQSPWFEFGADFVWYKPCIDQLEYAGTISQTVNPFPPAETLTHAHVKSIHEKWEPGYKAYFSLKNLFCNLDFRASYQFVHIDTDSSTRAEEGQFITTPFLNPIVMDNIGAGNSITGTFKNAEATYKAKYHYWDAELIYPICCSDHYFKPHFGLAGILFHQRLVGDFSDPLFEIQGDTAATKWRSIFWSVGAKIGIDYEYFFCECMSLFSQAEGALIVGQFNSRFHQETVHGLNGSLNDYHVKKSSQGCHLVPGYHFALGFNYRGFVCQNAYLLRIGYELWSWNNLPNNPVFSADEKIGAQLNSSSLNQRTLGFHGLYVGASFSF